MFPTLRQVNVLGVLLICVISFTRLAVPRLQSSYQRPVRTVSYKGLLGNDPRLRSAVPRIAGAWKDRPVCVVLSDCSQCNAYRINIARDHLLPERSLVLMIASKADPAALADLRRTYPDVKVVQMTPALTSYLNPIFEPRAYAVGPDGGLSYLQPPAQPFEEALQYAANSN